VRHGSALGDIVDILLGQVKNAFVCRTDVCHTELQKKQFGVLDQVYVGMKTEGIFGI
jgi:hypothetical protein